jgi:spermidine synthase
VAGLWLPIGLRPDLLPAGAEPVLWVPWLLISSMAPLFFVVSTQAPLMQRWYAMESGRGEPYALYAASNFGSFAGLISYPLIVEPLLTLDQQSRLWTAGYGVLVLLVAGCAIATIGGELRQDPGETSPPPPLRTMLRWVVLAAVPSGLMLSTTTHLTTDIVAMPLLWVVPLGLYLLSFVVAFARRRLPTEAVTRLAPPAIMITGAFAFAGGSDHPILSAALGLLLLFIVAVTLHGELYRHRPAAEHLTRFYLAMAVGGMVGGIFCAILAPILFDWTYEHPLLILASALLVPQVPLLRSIGWLWRAPWSNWIAISFPLIAIGLSLAVDRPLTLLSGYAATAAGMIIILLALLSIGKRWVFAACLAALMLCYGGWWTLDVSLFWHTRTRSYFGIYTISNNAGGTARILTHGTTLHGLQNLAPAHRLEPTTYYAPRSGVGLAMRSAMTLYGPNTRIGVVGLGTGTLSCYAVPGQSWRFFEIDPAMVEIATRSGHFTFLRRCAPDARIIVGDARLSLAHQPVGRLDLLALDAFSSDAVPMHLLTREAFGVYARALQPGGLLLVHISNRYVDLAPVVAAAADAGGWHAVELTYEPTESEAAHHASVSVWIAMSRNPVALDSLIFASAREGDWRKLRPRAGFPGWSDDYASILPLLRPAFSEASSSDRPPPSRE